LKVSRLLRQAGIRKSKGIPVLAVFMFLILLVFQEKNLHRFLTPFRSKAEFSKNSVYRMLNGQKYNWRRFIHSLSAKVIGFISPLNGPERVKVLILGYLGEKLFDNDCFQELGMMNSLSVFTETGILLHHSW
jgi:hypothetical protein